MKRKEEDAEVLIPAETKAKPQSEEPLRKHAKRHLPSGRSHKKKLWSPDILCQTHLHSDPFRRDISPWLQWPEMSLYERARKSLDSLLCSKCADRVEEKLIEQRVDPGQKVGTRRTPAQMCLTLPFKHVWPAIIMIVISIVFSYYLHNRKPEKEKAERFGNHTDSSQARGFQEQFGKRENETRIMEPKKRTFWEPKKGKEEPVEKDISLPFTKSGTPSFSFLSQLMVVHNEHEGILAELGDNLSETVLIEKEEPTEQQDSQSGEKSQESEESLKEKEAHILKTIKN